MSDDGLTLRDRIAAHVSRQIASQAWAVGDRVPSESALMAQFGASRMTVHHALRDLTSRGLLRRHKGAGTFVAAPRPYVGVFDHRDIIAEIESHGCRHSARVVRQIRRPPTPEEAEAFRLPAGADLFHAVIVHAADGVPVELEDRLINPSILPDGMAVDLEKRSLFSLLLNSRPYREGSESLQAIIPTDPDRRLLGLARGQPCLEIVRRTWSPQGVVTQARLLRTGRLGRLQGRIATSPDPVEDPQGRSS